MENVEENFCFKHLTEFPCKDCQIDKLKMDVAIAELKFINVKIKTHLYRMLLKMGEAFTQSKTLNENALKKWGDLITTTFLEENKGKAKNET